MGTIQHNAIVVTTWSKELALEAHTQATMIFPEVGEMMTSPTNQYVTFLIPPDGSKEGWDESDAGDKQRAVYIDWLRSKRNEDGSSPYAWVDVSYGEYGAHVDDTDCENLMAP